MTRSGFLKSLLVAIAAPKVLAEINLPMPKPAVKNNDLPSIKTNAVSKRRGVWFVLTEEMHKDSDYMQWLINDKNSDLNKKCIAEGIDLDKPFVYQSGYNNDDFINNCITVVIYQNVSTN